MINLKFCSFDCKLRLYAKNLKTKNLFTSKELKKKKS